MNTSVKQKTQLWPTFEEACRNQWESGGQRYALGEDKEFTDLICETVKDFCAGQILKHTGELVNTSPKPEIGFFKIAVWAFIWWIKEQENLTQVDKGEQFSSEADRTVETEAIKECPHCHSNAGFGRTIELNGICLWRCIACGVQV